MPAVSLQISLAPSDHRLAATLLPHQIKTWKNQVDEILLTLDTHRSRGRFGQDWEQGRAKLLELASGFPGVRIIDVDYSPAARAAVSAEFFGGATIPVKDCRGGPYYAYFFGLHAARHDWVLHSDADMMFGGGSPHWLTEAVSLYQEKHDILFTAPLPGPPSQEGTLRQLCGYPQALSTSPAYAFSQMSTRLFLFQRSRFKSTLGFLRPRPPAVRARMLAWLDGHPAQDLPEHLFTTAMAEHHLQRIDFLGSAPGMWSLHPPYRCEDFFLKLPAIVRRVEAGDLPVDQLGDHDMNDSLVDWSEARARMTKQRWWRRLGRRFACRTK
jgi:hypothetical protein